MPVKRTNGKRGPRLELVSAHPTRPDADRANRATPGAVLVVLDGAHDRPFLVVKVLSATQ